MVGRVPPVDVEVGMAMPAIARVILVMLAGGGLLAAGLLGAMALWVWRRGGFGVLASALLRSVAAVVVGIGGWFLAILAVVGVWPGLFASEDLAAVASGLAVGLCVYLAWVRPGAGAGLRYGALVAAVAWGLAGAWLGGHALDGLASGLTAILGAVLAANLAVLVLDLRLRRAPGLEARWKALVWRSGSAGIGTPVRGGGS